VRVDALTKMTSCRAVLKSRTGRGHYRYFFANNRLCYPRG
jgi:hypothetical protein